MKKAISLLLVGLLLLSGSLTGCLDGNGNSNGNNNTNETGIQWKDYKTGMEEVNETGKQAILYFYSPKSQMCKYTEQKILSNSQVEEKAKDFVMVKINVDDDNNRGILSYFRFEYIPYIPTIIFLNKSGIEMHRLIAYDVYNPDDVRGSITNLLKNMDKAKNDEIWGDDFAFQTLDGSTKHLSDFRGKAVIIDLMATWCGPCRMQMNELEKVLSHYKSQDVLQIISIDVDSRDTPDAIKSTFGDHINEWLFGMDKYGVAKRLVLEGAIPTLAIYDRYGRIMYLRPGLVQSQQLFTILTEIILM